MFLDEALGFQTVAPITIRRRRFTGPPPLRDATAQQVNEKSIERRLKVPDLNSRQGAGPNKLVESFVSRFERLARQWRPRRTHTAVPSDENPSYRQPEG